MQTHYDCIIAGSGHNALVAACYLARAGKTVLILEKNDYIGGATTSHRTFEEFDAKLSRYSYLISLLPEKIIKELGLNLELFTRRTASYTPYIRNGVPTGLLLSNVDKEISRESVLALGLGEEEWIGYRKFQERCVRFAGIIWDSLLEPLKSREQWEKRFSELGEIELWKDFVEYPIGELIEKYVQSDVLRGVLLTDARIGSYTSAHDPSLLQNKTFIYHIIGNKTGEWKVPKGGMGELVNQLKKKAELWGVKFITGAEVRSIENVKSGIRINDTYTCSKLLWNAAPHLLERYLSNIRSGKFAINEGTAFKINILLEKLPRLRDKSVSPADAFCGTFHINQNYTQQQKAFDETLQGEIPLNFPCEMYCHTLTDSSILSKELQERGYHTVTVFGLDMTYSLFRNEHESRKTEVLMRFFDGINEFLEEPFQECIARNSDGSFCVECKSAVDLENELGMPGGNIFHNNLSWFFAENVREEGLLGIETAHSDILLCGSGAKRGGGVSGIPGYLAARKILSSTC